MRERSKGEISFTFITKVLQSIIDGIYAESTNPEYDWTNSDGYVKHRTKIDELIGDFEHFWKPIYKNLQKIYGEEIAKFIQKKLLTYHIRHNKGGFTDFCLWLHISPELELGEYERLKDQIQKEDRLSTYLT